MSGTRFACRNLDMSEITYRGLPGIAILHQVVVEGGQHGSQVCHYSHTIYNIDHSGWVSAGDFWPRLHNKKFHSLRCVATARNMTPRVDQIQSLS